MLGVLLKSSICILFFLITFAPFKYYIVKSPFFVYIFCASLFRLVQPGSLFIRKNMNIIAWSFYYSIIGVLFIILGLFNGAEENSAIYLVPLYVIYPLLLSVLCTALDEKISNLLLNILIYSSVLISIYILINILSIDSNFMKSILPANNLARNSTLTDGIAAVALVSISTLIFSVPYLITILQMPSIPSFIKLSRIKLLLALFILIAGVLLSGRRALFVILVMSLFTCYFFVFFLPRNEAFYVYSKFPLKIMANLLILLIVSFYILNNMGFNIMAYVDNIIAFLFKSSEMVRAEQTQVLIDYWLQSPIIGSGHGVATEYIRSELKPWRYEKSYYALLFHTGLIGFVLYSLGIVWIFYKGIMIIKYGGHQAYNTIGLLNGLLSMLIAYSTNPYFDALDILWVIFLPAWYVNHYSKNYVLQTCNE